MERMTSGMIRRLGKWSVYFSGIQAVRKQKPRRSKYSATFESLYRWNEWGLLNNRVIIKRQWSKERVRGDRDVTVSIGD